MHKYGLEFEPVPGRPDWFLARDVRDEEARANASRIHRESDLENDLVFCGLDQSSGANKLYLIQSGDSVEVARQFAVGAHAMSDNEDIVTVTRQMLSAVFAVAPFRLSLVNPTAFEAHFSSYLDEKAASQVLQVIEQHGCHGMDYYASRFVDLTDADIIGSLVSDQCLHLWWD